MNKTIVPVAVFALLTSINCIPCLAQSAGLPPTVMGKFVHQPGDNQYSQATQATRHAPPPQAAPMQMGGAPAPSVGWEPTPRPFRPDPSLEPIAADEPVAPNGFPPLPDRLELPVSLGWAPGGGGGGGGAGGYGGGDGGGGGGGGAGPGTGGIGDPAAYGVHQHYQHQPAGAYVPANQKRGYYKVGTPESFAAGGSPDAAPAAPSDPAAAAAAAALRGLGKEPKLNGEADQNVTAPPQAVTINQATTQDLSLPEDDFSRKATPNRNPAAKGASRMAKQAGRMIMNRAYSTGLGAMGSLHF